MSVKRIQDIDIKTKGLFVGLYGVNGQEFYLDSDLRKYNFYQQLSIYLKEEGYDKVVMYDAVNNFHSYFKTDLDQLKYSSKTPQQSKEKKSRVKNSIGRRRKTQVKSETQENPNSSITFYTTGDKRNGFYRDQMNTRIRDYFQREINNSKAKTAFIIKDFNNLNNDQQDNYVALFREAQQNYIINNSQNKVLIIYDSLSSESLIEKFHQNRGKLMYNKFFEEIFVKAMGESKELISETTFKVDKPKKSEIENFINYERIKNGKKVDLLNINKISEELVLLNNSLNKWHKEIKKVSSIEVSELNSMLGFNINLNKSSPLQELNKLTGLSGVKSFFEELVANVQYDIQQAELENKPLEISYGLHMVFTGNPGTGKTTVARLVGEIFKSLGILRRGHCVEADRESLVGSYQGHSATKTKQLVESAIDGVLFIDEAYNLINGEGDSFGNEASTTLLKLMEDNLGKQIVIIAGYTKEINEFINSNPGYSSRFTSYINFEDFDLTELSEIFENQAQSQNYELDSDCQQIYQGLLGSTINRIKGYDNARGVRKLWGQVLSNHKKRIVKESKDGIKHNLNQRLTITKDDFETNSIQAIDIENSLQELNKLTGLSGVKSFFEELVANVQYDIQQAELENKPLEISYGLHMVFTGNPGTGKTTVARLVGEIFKSLGILRRGHCVEADRESLVGSYQGHSATKTKQLVESAIDGVLFIDEAYNLINGEGDSFGNEASTTLLKLMEDNLGKQIVIIAGYTKEINEFINSNPGYSSRFTTYINFEDFDLTELSEIFENQAQSQNYELDSDCQQIYQGLLGSTINRIKGYDNARGVRKLWGQVLSNHKKRIVKEGKDGIKHNLNQRLTITKDDFDLNKL